MKKLEMHVHTSPMSLCPNQTVEQQAEHYYKCGYDAIMLTNHYSRAHIERYGVDMKDYLRAFINEYRRMKKECEKYGIEVFLGAEVTLYGWYSKWIKKQYDDIEKVKKELYADYILVGVTEEFLWENPWLCDMTQRELYETCDRNGVLLIQAHPLRVEQGHSLKEIKYLHGIELNSCIRFDPNEEKILQIAKDNDLVVTVGNDAHFDHCYFRGATFIPDDIHSSVELAQYLRKVRVPDYSLNELDPVSTYRNEK